MTKIPIYVSRKVINAQKIYDWAKKVGIENITPAEKMHVTIAYSKTPVDRDLVFNSLNSNIIHSYGNESRTIKHFDNVRVLAFESILLKNRHKEILSYGASWDFPTYIPHITLSYDNNQDLRDIEPYAGKIHLGPEILEKLDEDYT